LIKFLQFPSANRNILISGKREIHNLRWERKEEEKKKERYFTKLCFVLFSTAHKKKEIAPE